MKEESSEEAALFAIVHALGSRMHPRVFLGIGDDAALWQPSRSHRSAISSDAFVDGVHFQRGVTSSNRIGARAINAATSDLAAMGARPLLATVSLGFPPDCGIPEISELTDGIALAASRLELSIVGGDCTRSERLTLSVTVIGEVRSTQAKRRDGARVGDIVAITGDLGASFAGLRALADSSLLDGALRSEAIDAYESPVARVAEGRWLSASKHVHAMMDCSDGLGRDSARMARASNVGILLERIPVARSLAAMAQRGGEDAEALALAAGEDYELIAAVAPRAFPYLNARFKARFGRELLPVGYCDAQAGVRWRRNETQTRVEHFGWDHFL